MSPSPEDRVSELDKLRPSSEVGGEGGSPGDVELDQHRRVGTGSEGGQTWRPADEKDQKIDEVRRDETGVGRRAPVD